MLNVPNSIWRPPIGVPSFNGSPAAQQTAPAPEQVVVAANTGNNITVRQLLTGVRRGQVAAFPDNRYAGDNPVAACACGRLLYRAYPSAGQAGNAQTDGKGAVGVAGLSRDRIDESGHRHIPVSMPVSAISSEAPATAFQPTFFDVVLKKLEDRINRSPLARSLPSYTLAVLGMAGSRQKAPGYVPLSIELTYSRLTVNHEVLLTIAVTDCHGFRRVSPLRIFEKPADASGEAALIERLLPEGAELALHELTNSKGNNYVKTIPTGRAEPYKWRVQIGESFNPPMEASEVGARLAEFCAVDVERPGPIDPRPRNIAGSGFARTLLDRMRSYLATKLNARWRDINWPEVLLIVTGLKDMNADPPGDEIKIYVHLWYTLLPDEDANGNAKGDVDLLITRRNGDFMESFRCLCRRSDYINLKTFYGHLLFFGAFAATTGPKNLPDKKAVTHLRGRIGESLWPRMSGDMLGRAMRAYYPLPAWGERTGTLRDSDGNVIPNVTHFLS